MGSFFSSDRVPTTNPPDREDAVITSLVSKYSKFHSFSDWSDFNTEYMDYLAVKKKIKFQDFRMLIDMLEIRKNMYLFFMGSHIYPVSFEGCDMEEVSDYFFKKLEIAIHYDYSQNVDFLLYHGARRLRGSNYEGNYDDKNKKLKNIHRCVLLREMFEKNNASHFLE